MKNKWWKCEELPSNKGYIKKEKRKENVRGTLFAE